MSFKKVFTIVMGLALLALAGCVRDAEPPVVAITAPLNDATVYDSVSVRATASDNVGVAAVEFYVDDTMRFEDSEAPYEYDWDTKPLQDSTYHSVVVKAYDEADNAGADTVRVLVWRAVRVTIKSPQDGAAVYGIEVIQVEARADDGLESVELYIDGALCHACADTSFGWQWDTRTLEDASSHTIIARASDVNGLEMADTVTVTVSPPTVSASIVSPCDGAVIEDTVTILVESESKEGVMARCEFYVDDTLRRTRGVNPDLSGEFDYLWTRPPKPDGDSCIVIVKAYDEFDNVGEDTITVLVRTHIKWRYTLKNRIGSPAVDSEGTIYVSDGETGLYAFNPEGSLEWHYEIENGFKSPASIGPDGTIYVGAYHALYAFDPAGSVKWSYTKKYATFNCAPAVAEDGTIYVGAEGVLLAISPEGGTNWQCDLPFGYIRTSPVIADDGTIFVAGEYMVCAVSPEGYQKWVRGIGDLVSFSLSLGTYGTVYVGSLDKRLYALDPADGAIKWFYNTEGAVMAAPAVGADNILCFPSHDGYFYALSPNGTLKWRSELEGSSLAVPAIASDGTIHVLAGRYFYSFNPDGSLEWRTAMEGATEGSTAVGPDGTVYVCESQHFYAFEGSSPLASSPWPMLGHDAQHTGRAD